MAVYNEARAAGKRTPASIRRILEARVQLAPHLASGWEAFWELNTFRQSAFGIGLLPLKFTDIAAYILINEYEGGEESEELMWTLGILDREIFSYYAEEKDKKDKADAKKKQHGDTREIKGRK